MLWARSPSPSRDHRFRRQAMAQPVEMSPRVFSETLAASASLGVVSMAIWSLGKTPYRWETWR